MIASKRAHVFAASVQFEYRPTGSPAGRPGSNGPLSFNQPLFSAADDFVTL
jgi:hypothetical protein